MTNHHDRPIMAIQPTNQPCLTNKPTSHPQLQQQTITTANQETHQPTKKPTSQPVRQASTNQSTRFALCFDVVLYVLMCHQSGCHNQC